jgi:hypothetical protein
MYIVPKTKAYSVFDYSSKQTRHFNDWWDLIRYLSDKTDYIAHNVNDICGYFDCGRFKLFPPVDHYHPDHIVDRAIFLLEGGVDQPTVIRKRWVYQRNLFVFDEYDRIVNLSLIKEALKEYDPQKIKHRHYSYRPRIFEYRRDPVAWTGHHSR